VNAPMGDTMALREVSPSNSHGKRQPLVQFSVRLDREVILNLKKIAKQKHCSFQEVVREGLDLLLKK
jgi:hypothetical protein